MELLLIGLAVCAGIGWLIASSTGRMKPGEAAFGSFMLGPIGLLIVMVKCRPR